MKSETKRSPTRTLQTLAAFFLLFQSLGGHVLAKTQPLGQHHLLGEGIHFKGLSIWPAYSVSPTPDIREDIIGLADAQERGLAQVREKSSADIPNSQTSLSSRTSGSSGAQVSELVVENKGDQAILILAGTLLKGGNQDRQISQDFIVPAKKTVAVGAFCVEQGRWQNHQAR